MPIAREHSDHVQRSKRLLSLLREKKELPEWVIIASYYKAVHYAEAMFDCLPVDPSAPHTPHCHDHKQRRKQLKENPRFSAVWKRFRPIENWSMLARYLDPKQLKASGFTGQYDLSQASAFTETWQRVVDNRLPSLKAAIAVLVPARFGMIFS